jgi:hypothetical protein
MGMSPMATSLSMIAAAGMAGRRALREAMEELDNHNELIWKTAVAAM